MTQPIPLWAATLLALALLVELAVGVGLLRLAARTGQWPELTLGTFAVSAAIGNLGTVAAMRLEPEAGPDFANALAAVGQLLAICGNHALALATWQVYRRSAWWAALLFAATSAALILGWVGNVLGGSPARLAENSVPDLLVLGARCLIFAWWSAECFAEAAQLGRRARADAWLAHRVLLWGVVGMGGAFVMLTLLLSGLWLGAANRTHPPVLAAIALATLGMSACSWLAFRPPAFYRRRLGLGETRRA
jgi:hypothetical protein